MADHTVTCCMVTELAMHRRTTWFLRWGLRHTFLGWSRGLALVQSLAVQTLLASFRAVS